MHEIGRKYPQDTVLLGSGKEAGKLEFTTLPESRAAAGLYQQATGERPPFCTGGLACCPRPLARRTQ